jgi:rubrerythrin
MRAEDTGPDGMEQPQTVDQLIEMAIAMERHAAARFDALAGEMARAGHPELSDLFAELGDEERRHEAHILAWGAAPADAGKRAAREWRSPEAFSEGDREEAGGDHLMTPHRALALAVRNEERAFSLFSTIAAMANSAAVREHAETLATEELGHLVRLRVERRRAWRAQAERASRRTPEKSVLALRSLPALVARALEIEREAVGRMGEYSAALEAIGETRAATSLRAEAEEIGRHIITLEHRAGELDLPLPSPPPSDNAPPLEDEGGGFDGASPQAILTHALGDADAALTFYLAAADAGGSEEMVSLAQQMAEHALARLARVRALFDG